MSRPDGTYTTLCNFDGTDGSRPQSALVRAADGNFYGTASYGGVKMKGCQAGSGCGTIYRVTPEGDLTMLHRFDISTDGAYPNGLIEATDGSFFGTTNIGGAGDTCSYGCGTVFAFSVGLRPFIEAVPVSGGPGAAVTILGTNLTPNGAVQTSKQAPQPNHPFQ